MRHDFYARLPSAAPCVRVAVDADGEAPGAEVVNTVGAGDALLAGFLACGADASALPEAIAWSVAACGSPGTRMRPTTDADRALVVVHPRLDPARRLVA